MSIEQALCTEYKRFLEAGKLPSMSADDLLSEADERGLSYRQILWLKDFLRRWEDFVESKIND